MEKNRQYFIDIVNKFIYGGEYVAPPDIDWYEIKKIAEIQSLLGLVGIVTSRSNIENMPLDCSELFEYMIFENARRGMVIERVFKEVTEALNKYNIPHITVKGYVLRNLYPEKDMRSMGDLDFVVKEENMLKAKTALEEAGFAFDKRYRGEWSYKKHGQRVELTHSLVDADVGFFNYEEYMSQIFEHVVKMDNCTYQLTNEFHFIYMILHTMKHFYAEGCGIRMIIDMALFLNKYKSELDWDYINGELKKLKTDVFAKNMIALCGRLFKTDVPDDMDPELFEAVFDYIMTGGTFGFARKNLGVADGRNMMAKNQSVAVNLFHRAFPNDDTMRGLINWYYDKTKLLLPAAWVYRWIHSIVTKRGMLLKSLINLGSKEESKKQYELLKKIGLYKK